MIASLTTNKSSVLAGGCNSLPPKKGNWPPPCGGPRSIKAKWTNSSVTLSRSLNLTKKRIAHITTKCWSKNVLTGGGLMVFLTAPEKSAGHPIKALLSFRLLDPACAWKMLPSIKVLTRASRDTGKTWLNKALNRTRDREVSLPKAYKDSAMQHSFLGATGLWLCEVCQCWKGTRSPYPRNDVTRPWSSRGGSQFERLAFLSPDR